MHTRAIGCSVVTLERLLPTFFRGAASIYASREIHQKVSSEFNPATNTSMTGCISATARRLIASYAHNYDDEMRLYHAAKRLFWSKVLRAEPGPRDQPGGRPGDGERSSDAGSRAS